MTGFAKTGLIAAVLKLLLIFVLVQTDTCIPCKKHWLLLLYVHTIIIPGELSKG